MTTPTEALPFLIRLSPKQIQEIAGMFCQEMERGLRQEPSSLKMLPSFLDVPGHDLAGIFAAIDFGGTNLRVMEVELAGRRACIRSLRKQELPKGIDSNTLFSLLAELVAEVVANSDYLGHTFSYPCLQRSVNEAHLIHWTKEVDIPGVEGRDINRLLEDAFKQKGLAIKPDAILNDTVGTLLTAAYHNPQVDIAAICGTGHNACYHESLPVFGRPMIINMESGNFDKLPFTPLDEQLDAASDKPGAQRLEKMVSGAYLGELMRLALLELNRRGLLDASSSFWEVPHILGGEDVACWLKANSTADWLQLRGLAPWPYQADVLAVQCCREIVQRSAQLAAATFLGVLAHIDPCIERRHVIAIDGSLYEKMPGYEAEMALTIKEALGKACAQVEIKLVKDGSGIGAAIAAAIASQQKNAISVTS